jgi:hypothetical protein
MSTNPSSGAVAAAFILALIALLGWLILLPNVDWLNSSDAAGNGLAQVFAAFETIVVWVLLAVLTFVCGVSGRMPGSGAIAAVILIPASMVAALYGLGLLARPDLPPYLWPAVALVAPPPLIVVYALWAIAPPLRDKLPANAATIVVWGCVLAATLAIWPLSAMRAVAMQRAREILAPQSLAAIMR